MNSQTPFPISDPVDVVGFTPDPGNPINPGLPGLPQFPQLPFPQQPVELPQFPGPVFVPCKLKLPQGCYRISMERNTHLPQQLSSGFQGTFRVENSLDANGNQRHEISGDFYRRPRLVIGGPFPVQPVLFDGAPQIPIFSRSRYHSYLKVTNVQKTFFVRQGQKCRITLTVEEYNYTPPANDSSHGNFPDAPTRTLTIVLERATPPAGHTGPAFEGKVFQGATELPFVFRMVWVSDFFRRATLEVENVTGAAIPAAAGTHTFQTIYNTVGWDLNVVTGNTNLPVPAAVSAAGRWSDADLHAFMVANRNPATNLDTSWTYYYVAVPLDSASPSGLFGIMFDQTGDQREGSCNFVNNLTGDFGDAASKLRSAVHEIGHGFNQLHPQNEDPALLLENFIMTQSGATRTAILSAGGRYPDDIRFEFSPHHRHHLIHAPDMVVRPGGEDFGFGHSAVLAGSHNPEDGEFATDMGLTLTLSTVRNHIKLGEPLQLNIVLRNDGPADLPVPQSISWKTLNTSIAVGALDGNQREVSSFAHVCDSSGLTTLKPGEALETTEYVYWDTNGFAFTQPGVHKVDVAVGWNADGIRFALNADHYIWVDYPVTAKENETAAALMHPEVGKYVALGGNATHLKTAVQRIADARKLQKDHPGNALITQLDQA